MPRERNHTMPIATAPAITPLTEGHTPILMQHPEHEDGDRDRGGNDEAELELDRRNVVERMGETFAPGHDAETSGCGSPAA